MHVIFDSKISFAGFLDYFLFEIGKDEFELKKGT